MMIMDEEVSMMHNVGRCMMYGDDDDDDDGDNGDDDA